MDSAVSEEDEVAVIAAAVSAVRAAVVVARLHR